MDFDERIYTQFAVNTKLIPFNALQIKDSSEGKNFVFYHLERESQLRLTPVTRPHYKRGAILLGWTVEASCYVSQNSAYFLEELKTIMGYMQNDEFKAIFHLGSSVADFVYSNSEYNPPTRINSTGSLTITISSKRLHALLEQETVEFRLRNIIRIKGFAGKDDISYE